MEFLDGRVFTDPLMPEVSARERGAMYVPASMSILMLLMRKERKETKKKRENSDKGGRWRSAITTLMNLHTLSYSVLGLDTWARIRASTGGKSEHSRR
jgi:hypothetical protein